MRASGLASRLDADFYEEPHPLDALVVRIQSRPGNYENLGELLKIDPKSLTPKGRIDYLAALEKQYSWLFSLVQEATLAVAGLEPTLSDGAFDGIDEAQREDVATALRLAPNTAQGRIDVARTLSNHLPATCEALATGDISSSHATLIARETADALLRGVSPDILPLIEEKALAHSEFHTAAQVGKKLKTLFAQFAPEIFEARSEIARDTRSVRVYPEADGMSTLIALLPAEDAQTVYLAINEAIANSPLEISEGVTDSRSVDMKRADALTTIAADYLARVEEEAKSHGTRKRSATLNLTMDLPTLLGLAENPAQLSGHGPIPASVGRKLAADAKWRKFITDPLTGNLIDMGRESYSPSQPLIDYLNARDRICRFPGCSQPARMSDIDHAIPWDEGGETSRSNLGILCRRHHRLKTHGDWRLVSNEDGSCTWTSPKGKEFFVPARPFDESVANLN